MAKQGDGNLRLTIISLVASGGLIVGLAACFIIYKSQLALAQAADSLSDVFTSAVLIFSVAVARRPQDHDHPFGHHRAEPLGALVAAVLAGVLAFAVIRSAIESLLGGQQPQLDWPVAAVLGVKLLVKVGIMAACMKRLKHDKSPAIGALFVDARNDTVANSVALAGFFAARYGWPELDAWLAMPAALWIAYSGFRLARENIRLLMGEAPPPERQRELLELARKIEGVRDAHDLRAQFIGTTLQVHVHVKVDAALSVGQGHDIGEAVRKRLESEDDVSHVSVHVDSE